MDPYEAEFETNDPGAELGTQVDFSFLDYGNAEDNTGNFSQLDVEVSFSHLSSHAATELQSFPFSRSLKKSLKPSLSL